MDGTTTDINNYGNETQSPSSVQTDAANFANGQYLPVVLGSVLGALVLGLAIYVLWLLRRRHQRSGRRSLAATFRAVTPLSDSEFESWRRPSTNQRQWPEKYPISTIDSRPLPRISRAPSQPKTTKPVLINPFDTPNPQSMRPVVHTRRKSSTVSIQDRPPTPYSPASPKLRKSSESKEDLWGAASPTHTKPAQARVYHPSTSESSTFDFDLEGRLPQYNDRYAKI